MRTLSASRTIRLVAVLLAMFLGFGVVTAGPAQAADEVSKSENLNADQLKRLAGLPEDQRNGIRDRLNQELAKGVCANPASVLPWAWGIARRSPLKHSERFSPPPRKALDYKPNRAWSATVQAWLPPRSPALP